MENREMKAYLVNVQAILDGARLERERIRRLEVQQDLVIKKRAIHEV